MSYIYIKINYNNNAKTYIIKGSLRKKVREKENTPMARVPGGLFLWSINTIMVVNKGGSCGGVA